MKRLTPILLIIFSILCLQAPVVSAEILAMINYESKPDDSLKELKLPFGAQGRQEGIAIMDVDPESDAYGDILMNIPLPADLTAHHIFYNRDASKAYVTALGKSELRVIDMNQFPYRVKVISVPECQVGEDIVFSDDNKNWYLTCMGSNKLIVGDAQQDTPIKAIDIPNLYPHGIAIHNGIDRILVTSTVRASDLGDARETISVFEASSGKLLSSHKVSNKPSPSGEAPVEILFVPDANPPVALITNMFGNTLWSATWNPDSKEFDVAQVFDFAELKVGVPLEIYFTQGGKRLYVTTAKPGHLHIFDISVNPTKLKLLKSLPAAEGSHHVAFTKNGHYAFVQNSLLNLPGMSDGAITVVDLQEESVLGNLDTFKSKGFNPNSIVLLPQWNDPAGH